MSNGYGGGSSTGSGQRVAAPQQSRVNAQGQIAPEGFHYMPDGSLMSDEEHARLYSSKTIKGFDLDLSDLSAVGEARAFNITGDADGEFILEVKNNANGNYYNFATNKFQTTQYKLEGILTGGVYSGQIQFPSTITTDTVNGAVSSSASVTMDTAVASTMAVGDRVRGNLTLNAGEFTVASLDSTNVFSLSSSTSIDDGTTLSFASSAQYDIYLYAKPGTKHLDHSEFRFLDNSIDLNSSIGSNSLMLQKVIYQYADVSLTIDKISPSSTIEMTGSGHTTKTIVVPRGKSKGKVPFSIKSIVSTASKAYEILKQPDISDILGKKTITISDTESSAGIGSTPKLLQGENIYPTARTAFTGDDVNGAVTEGSVVRMDAVDLSVVIAVGDKITSPTTTGTVNGTQNGVSTIRIDENPATIMAVGDQVFGCDKCSTDVVTVESIDSTSQFSVVQESGGGVSVSVTDDATLTFSSKVNRSLTTVTVVETSGTATDFTMSQAIKFRDDQPLTFTPQANLQWPVSDIDGIPLGALLKATNIPANTFVSNYSDTTVVKQGTAGEETIVNYQAPFKTTNGQKPTITNGVITAQPGNLIFSNQCNLILAGDSVDVLGYGQENIRNLSGFELRLTDLKITLAPITTTSTAACNSTTLAVSSVNGILPNVSTVSGIGINAALSNPIVTARSATSGAGNLTLSTSQVLESGQEFTFAGAGQEATITGNIEILKAGTSDGTVFFDMENLLSIT